MNQFPLITEITELKIIREPAEKKESPSRHKINSDAIQFGLDPNSKIGHNCPEGWRMEIMLKAKCYLRMPWQTRPDSSTRMSNTRTPKTSWS